MEAGFVNLVITKDLSKLGRDYIMTGYYNEIFFPSHDVRYISINDNVDTLYDNNDIAPFKNILNDMYAKDISRKVKSAYYKDDNTRTTLGLYIELQLHYIAYLFNNEHGVNGADMGRATWNEDKSAYICEAIARALSYLLHNQHLLVKK